MKESIFVIVLVILVIVGGVMLDGCTERSDRRDIHEWASARHLEVARVERCHFRHGPFWFRNKHDRVYEFEARLPNGGSEVWWMRTGMFSNDFKRGEWE